MPATPRRVRSALKKKTASPRPPKPSAKAKALHLDALTHNWDDGVAELQRVVDHAACDLGTALAIYWMGAPGFDQQYVRVSEVDGWRRETFRFLRKLERRLLRRDFATAGILFNPRFDRTTLSKTGHDWTAEYDDVKVRRPIPPALMEPSCADPAWDARGRKPIRNTAARLT